MPCSTLRLMERFQPLLVNASIRRISADMRVLGYLVFSLVLLALLILISARVFGENIGVIYYIVLIVGIGASILVGSKFKFLMADIAAVNSFPAFALLFELTRSSDGALATILSFLMVGFLCAASVYLFLRILGWTSPKSGVR